MAFADDIAIITKNMDAASKLIEMVSNDFDRIGLEINMNKSMAIIIKDGKQTYLENGLKLIDGKHIKTYKIGEKLKYLGINFEDEIIFDEIKILSKLKDDLETLTNSPLLHADQKINIINQFIWPTLIYTLQSAPLYKIKKSFLKDTDTLIRGCVKNIRVVYHRTHQTQCCIQKENSVVLELYARHGKHNYNISTSHKNWKRSMTQIE